MFHCAKLAATFLGLPLLLPAVVLVSNFPLNSQGGAGYTVDNNQSTALVITIGATPIRFDRLETGFSVQCSNDCPYTVEGGIFADGGNAPGPLLSAFIPQALNTLTEEQVNFTTAAPFVLAANATYWLVLTGALIPPSGADWIDGGEPYMDTIFASSPGFSVSLNGVWTPVNENPVPGSDGNPQAQVIGTLVPEPGTTGLLAAGLLGLVAYRRRRHSSN